MKIIIKPLRLGDFACPTIQAGEKQKRENKKCQNQF